MTWTVDAQPNGSVTYTFSVPELSANHVAPKPSEQLKPKPVMAKRFLVFAGEHYDANMAWTQFVNSFDTLDEAIACAKEKAVGIDSAQVVDLHQSLVVHEEDSPYYSGQGD